ncbi:AraC family transcriptional regulator [Neotabrizicola sp. VNH66]|uniref:AraC family transcriptional regulator n=1 Tax=Neotabrizicola sp. VNH66 TaxID=3400918 RepID=UPI003C0E7ED1
MRKNGAGTPEPLIRAATLTPLLDFIADTLGNPAEVLGDLGIELPPVSDPYAQIPLAHYVDLLERVARGTGTPNLGLRMSMRLRPADLGPVGVLFSLSPSIQAGLTGLANHGSTLQHGTHSSLFEQDGELIWTYRLADGSIWPRRQDAEFSLGTVCQLIRQSFSAGWAPLEVHFEHGPPADLLPLQKVFRAPLLFHQPANRLILERQEAERRHRTEDGGLARILEHHIADLHAQHRPPASLTEQAQRLIAVSLGQRPVTLATLAADLRMSERSLQRGLAAEGTSLRQLVQAHRAELARHLLEHTGMRLSQVAATLGYADSTVFWRAWRSWTGEEPSASRRSRS